MSTIIAIDIGTTGAKAALVDRAGQLLASSTATHPTFTAAGNVVEQAPQDWWVGACEALQAVWANAPAHGAVAAVILSGQMQDLILLGVEDVVGRAILYSDARAGAEAAALQAQVGAATLTQITGNEQGAASVLAKWLWLQRHAPEQLAACRTLLLGAHDYVAWRLCGVVGADSTTAATTGLFELFRAEWATGLLATMGLDAALLPPLGVSGAQIGRVSAAAAQATGIPVGTPVLQGVGDLGATTIGVGAGEPGVLYAYLGTSGWIAYSVASAISMPERGVFTLRHPDGERFIQVAPILTAGGNLDWLRGVLTPAGEAPLDYARANELASQAPPGSRGLLYLPYLNGERSPFSDAHALAGFVGISPATTPAELARAVMEGTAFAYRGLRDALGVVQTGPLLLAGGGGNSPLWAQILADVLGSPVQVVAAPGDAPARGAAIIAGRALGWYPSLTPSADFFPIRASYAPQLAAVARMEQLYPIFRALYPALKEAFRALALV